MIIAAKNNIVGNVIKRQAFKTNKSVFALVANRGMKRIIIDNNITHDNYTLFT